jgi:hypothetical protein
METSFARVASAALLLAGIGAVSQAAPSLHSALTKAKKSVQAEADQAAEPYQWGLQSIIQAGLISRDVTILGDDSFASYQGRKFNLSQGQINAGVTDWLQLVYGEQYVLAKGRSAGSRFNLSDYFVGFRAVVKRPTSTDPTAISVQYQTVRPDTASADTTNSSATFAGTINNVFAVNYLDRHKDQIQFQYTDISAGTGLYGHVFSAGFGHDYELGEFVKTRIQGNFVAESYQAASESSNFELRPIIFGEFEVTPTPWLSVEAGLTVMPAGLPLAGGELTGLSSFDLYSPGGIVDDLRTKFIAFGSLRLLLHGKF